MKLFTRKSKKGNLEGVDKSPLGALNIVEPLRSGLKIEKDGSLSGPNLDEVLNSGVEFSSTLIDLAKEKRFLELGYTGKYEDRFFDVPNINTEVRRVSTITISYSKSLDHALLRQAVSQGLLNTIKKAFPVDELGSKTEAPLRYVAISDQKEKGRTDTDHIIFGNYDKNIFTGIDVYVEDGGKVYLNGRYKLTIKFSSDAEKYDKALANVIVDFANKITITKEDVLQEMINNTKRE
ncbi:MAG: hypothetical protein KGH53_02320 [Candidatus Micrarchaeota archaeon]|nr:hypothetical protein [Candidatus Micrarchaeota archaeon]